MESLGVGMHRGLCRACSTVPPRHPAAVHDEHAFGKRLAEVDVVGDEDQARARLPW